MSYLVIVESPAKAATIKGYLGSNYRVIASKGHIRDLPKSALGVDIENGFQPHYINIRGKGDVIAQLKKEARGATRVLLATDPDREGEAISWHLATVLGIPLDQPCRVTFNEITKSAVRAAVKKPRCIDCELVNSQQARRILDRIVGYQLSPFLWKNVKSGLSAGRVQSVATRIVCEREEEIRAFIPHEYWTLDVTLATSTGEMVAARYIGEKPSSETEAKQIENAIAGAPFQVVSVKSAQKHRMSAPPFITSTMQQEASRKLSFQPQQVMKIAQELYEGINLGADKGGVQGLITYMRTDSLRISEDAQNAARAFIVREYGDAYCPATPNVFKSKNMAQDAHEAIRPSNVELTPDSIRAKLSPDQYRLYKLIWERFVASQMSAAIYDTITVETECQGYRFRAGGYTVKFLGFTILHEHEDVEGGEQYAEMQLPKLAEGDKLSISGMESAQHFTEPPARYTDATLIKILEESGVGRPSTYATIITTIIAREYVERLGKSLVPTSLGEVTTRLMKENFPNIVDYEFTAQMEDQLDSIENGQTTMVEIMSSFYGDFARTLQTAMDSVSKEEIPVEETEYHCEKCGSKMIYKSGRFGKFLACSNYPSCRNTVTVDQNGEPTKREEVPVETPTKAEGKCELCGGDVVIRKGRFGEFYACSQYPSCRFTKQIIKEIDAPCPKCGSKVLIRHSRDRKVFYSCECYPACDFSIWDMPLAEKCPKCGEMLVYKKARKSVVCTGKDCQYARREEIKVME